MKYAVKSSKFSTNKLHGIFNTFEEAEHVRSITPNSYVKPLQWKKRK